MQLYRSLHTHLAVQYKGEPIPDVTCEGNEQQRRVNGCDPSRAHLPHIHTLAIGGLNVLTPGDWIMPVPGGPFCRVDDGLFRAHWEVPAETAEPVPVPEPPDPALPVAPIPALPPELVASENITSGAPGTATEGTN